ncbi:DUF294 nucleotidyltransferase-like domain-containing protein [Desulfococcaceae bacterium HSG8]|nr:DUF294 nucleotidyltransferase-like domain-containing protein [Desulfococcaceae bacterium HSG8]
MTTDKKEILNILMKTDPFEMLETEVLESLSDKIEVREYSPNTYVFKQGDASLDTLFIIASGLMEVTVTNDRGVETVVALRRQYDFFSETTVLSRQRYSASARVKEKLTCCLIRRRDLENLIYNYPEFSGFFNALISERMRVLYEEIVSEQSYEAYSSTESPLFRKRVSEVMSSPVITCRTRDKVTDASRLMDEKDISAIVVLDNEGKPRGILTEKNLVKYLIANQMYPISECRVDKVMKSNLVKISPEAFLGQALVSMIRSKAKHLIVVEREKLVGIITLIDLVKTRSTGNLLLTQDIEAQSNLKGLSHISGEIDNILNALIAEKAAVREIFEVMSELHERMSRRIIQLSEEKMKIMGWGPPPVEYCWINMGSAARYEQTLRTDQDNAIIYNDTETDSPEEVDPYFAKLAELIVEGHSQCGFAKCRGDVMATNPKWRRSLGQWISALKSWARSYDPEDTRILTILLDYRPIWGNMSLAEKFWEEIFSTFKESLTASHMMTKDELQYKLPISFLGTFVTEKSGPHKNEIDLKKAGAMHIVNGMRIFAVRHQISEPSTFGRLKQLTEKGAISAEDAEFFAASFETLMMFRIRESMKKAKQGKEPDNYIDPYSLRKRERMILKDALSGVAQLQKLVNKEFSVVWLNHFV